MCVVCVVCVSLFFNACDVTTQLAPDAPSPGRNKAQGKTEHYLCHTLTTRQTPRRACTPGSPNCLGAVSAQLFCTVRQRRANPCLSENPASRVTPPSTLSHFSMYSSSEFIAYVRLISLIHSSSYSQFSSSSNSSSDSEL